MDLLKLRYFIEALRLQPLVSANGGKNAFSYTEVKVVNTSSGLTAEEIEKLVNRAVKAGSLFGGLDSCLTRSVIRCRLMRKSGLEARVISGLNKKDGGLDGHAWVLWPGGPPHPPDPASFSSLEIHPSPEKFPGWIPVDVMLI